jgi:hypothetical protein
MNKVLFRLYDLFFVVDKWEISFYCDIYICVCVCVCVCVNRI